MTSAPTDVVQSTDFRASIDRLRAEIDDPNLGLFGPDSVMWRLIRPMPVLPMALIVAGLLEAPQPYVAYGTVGSEASRNFVPRFHRSIDAFFDWFCGDLDSAVHAARRVFGYHSQISGEIGEDVGHYRAGHHYEANQADVLIWVWATIIKPIKEVYEYLHGRLPADDVERYYAECQRFALLFGIEPALLPADWSAFVRYFDDYVASGALELSDEFKRTSGLSAALGRLSWRGRLVAGWFLSIETSMLPPTVRRQYDDLPHGVVAKAVGRVSLLGLRAAWSMVPRDLRGWPRVRAAYRRTGAEGEPGPRGQRLAARLPHPYGDKPGKPLAEHRRPTPKDAMSAPAIAS